MSKIVMTEQSSAPDTPGSGKVAIYVDTNGNLCWRKDDGVIVKIASAGTYTLTIPATGTAALLGTAQTFSAAQTFSNVLTAPGMKPASNSTTALQLQNAGGTAVLTVDTTNQLVITPTLLAQNSIRSERLTLAQDVVYTLANAPTAGLLVVGTTTRSACYGIIHYRTGSGGYCVGVVVGSEIELRTPADAKINGTTVNGSSSKFVVQAASDNTLVVQQRLTSASISNVNFLVIG